MMLKYKILSYRAFLFVILLLPGCNHSSKNKLPILGRKTVDQSMVDGVVKYDTIYHTIKDFSFFNQDSILVTNSTFDDKIYICDFFFTTCPTICPLMKAQLLRVYDKFEDNDEVMILSHTIDPEYDSVGVLRDFSSKLGVSSKKWHFVTGDREKIYDMAQTSYMVTAMADENEPGGYIHSGAFILVDKERHIRGLYDGTQPKEVDRMMIDISYLLKEYEKSK